MLNLPLEISVGEDFYLPMQWQFQVFDNFYPIDISGYSFEMQIGLEPFSTTLPVIIDVTSASGEIVISGPEGKAEIWIPRATFTPYMFGCWKYAVAATNTVGLVERLFGGSFNIKGWC
jgi:hypothetical protein